MTQPIEARTQSPKLPKNYICLPTNRSRSEIGRAPRMRDLPLNDRISAAASRHPPGRATV